MFCPSCGARVDGMKFCSECGEPLQTSAETEKNRSSEQTNIIDFLVYRPNQSNTPDVLISFFVDGYCYGTVKNNSSSTFQVISGVHNITIRMGNKTCSKPIDTSREKSCCIGVSGTPAQPVFFDMESDENSPHYSNDEEQTIQSNNTGKEKKQCSKWTAFLLCFFFGFLGLHKFYEGRTGAGILYILTVGIFGIGWIVDTIIILCKSDPYYV